MLYCRQTFANICINRDQLLLLCLNVFIFVSCILSYKFTLDELYSMKVLVTQRAESYKDWVINVQEILENKGSKKKGITNCLYPEYVLYHRPIFVRLTRFASLGYIIV